MALTISARARVEAIVTSSAFLSTLVAATISSAQTVAPCDAFQSGAAPPAGYVASWNPLISAEELLLSASRTAPGAPVTYTVGVGNQNHHVYKTGHFYNASWQPYTMAGASTDWIVGSGTATEQPPPSFDYSWVSYMCQSTASQWKCGCRDAACAASYWQLDEVKYPPAGSTTGGTSEDTTGGPVPAEFSCLDQSESVRTLSGQYDRTFKTSVQPNEAIDARGAKFVVHQANLEPTDWNVEINSQNAVWIPQGPRGGCWAGGVIESDFPICATFAAHKSGGDPGAISWGQHGMKVQGVYIRNIEDDLRPHDGADIVFEGLSPPETKFNPADDFHVSHVWAEYIRGDCFENDAYAGGIIRDSLFDGCNAWMSMTPGLRLRHLPDSFRDEAVGARNNLDGTSKTVTLDRVLVRMSLMPYPNVNTSAYKKISINGIPYGGGPFFKVRAKSPRIAIKNSIFLFDPETVGTHDYAFPNTIKSCSNNTIVWLGFGSFPGSYPKKCFTVTKDVNVWKQAVRDWHARNPDVGKQYKPPVREMGKVGVVNCR